MKPRDRELREAAWEKYRAALYRAHVVDAREVDAVRDLHLAFEAGYGCAVADKGDDEMAAAIASYEAASVRLHTLEGL